MEGRFAKNTIAFKRAIITEMLSIVSSLPDLYFTPKHPRHAAEEERILPYAEVTTSASRKIDGRNLFSLSPFLLLNPGT